MPRLFIALEVPEDVRNAIGCAQSELRSVIDPRAVTWSRPEQFHMTLKFLGEVRQEHVIPLGDALQSVSALFQPFTLHAAGVGFFPTPERPRVLWAGVQAGEDTGHLVKLHHAVEVAALPFTIEKPENRFHAHITLGRAKELFRSDMQRVLRWGNDYSKTEFGDWRAESFVLVQSHLSTDGATHTGIARFMFT